MERNLSILIIDDDISVHNVYRRILKQDKIDSAFDGLQALDKMKEQDYDVIFCDYHMPNMNGLQVLKTHRPKDSVIVSNSSDEKCNKLLSPYCDLSWTKNKNLKELLSFLQIVKELVPKKV